MHSKKEEKEEKLFLMHSSMAQGSGEMKSYRIRAWVVTRQNHEKKREKHDYMCENFCEGKQQKCAEFMSIFGGQNRSRKGNETHNLLYYYYHP